MMKKFWMTKSLLFVGFMAYVLFSGWSWASIPKESESSRPTHSFHFVLDPQESPAVEETASVMRRGLEDLGAGDIRGIFVLPGKGSLPSEGESETARVAFVDTVGECFMYDSVTRETEVCEEEEELLSGSLTYAPIDTSLSQERALQVAGLGDWICSHKEEIMIGAALGGTLAGGAALGGATLGGTLGRTLAGALAGGVGVGVGEVGVTTLGVAGALGAGAAAVGAEGTAAVLVALGAGATLGAGAALGAGVALGTVAVAGAALGAVAVAGVAVYYFCPARG